MSGKGSRLPTDDPFSIFIVNKVHTTFNKNIRDFYHFSLWLPSIDVGKL
jgi:hypothetical protein